MKWYPLCLHISGYGKVPNFPHILWYVSRVDTMSLFKRSKHVVITKKRGSHWKRNIKGFPREYIRLIDCVMKLSLSVKDNSITRTYSDRTSVQLLAASIHCVMGPVILVSLKRRRHLDKRGISDYSDWYLDKWYDSDGYCLMARVKLLYCRRGGMEVHHRHILILFWAKMVLCTLFK